MTRQTATIESADPSIEPEVAREDLTPRSDRHRYTVAVFVALMVVSLPYVWVLTDLWTGTVDPFRHVAPSNYYDLQARAMLAGHLHVPSGSIGIEAFVHNGQQYTYFGLFPSILRIPVLAVTHSFDGRLTGPSLLLAWVVTGLFSSLLLWRVRVMIRGQAKLGLAEATSCGVMVATLTGGSVLMYLAASPKVSHEDLAWSVALTIGSVFALLGVLERPSRGRVLASTALILFAAFDRSPTGYACIIGALLVAGWFALGRAGSGNRRWALPVLLAGLVPLVLSCAVNWAKLGTPFGLSEADQVWTHVNAHRRLYLAANGGSAFGFQFLPSTLYAYMQPAGVHIGSAFPFLSLPTAPAQAVGSVVLDQTYPTASVPASMPLLFLFGCWGVITAFRPRPVEGARMMRMLLVATAAGTAGVLLFGYIADRYLGDFLPFLALAGMIGLVDLWRRLDGRGQQARIIALALIVIVGVLEVWANVGTALTPTALWTSAQAERFVTTQRSISGAPSVMRGDTVPYWSPEGTLFAAGDCSGLYVSTGFSYRTVPGQQLQHDTWIPVQQGPGINHVLDVVFNRTVIQSDAPIPLVTYGKSTLVVLPTGVNQAELKVENPGAPSVHWPSASTSIVDVKQHRPYRISVTTDPNLHSIVVAWPGGGITHYLAGDGPAVVHTTPDASGANAQRVSIANVSPAAPSMALCRSLVRHSAN